MEYPKIETLFDRNPKTFKVVEGQIRCPEFMNINKWHITEKIDGTNIRVTLKKIWEKINGSETMGMWELEDKGWACLIQGRTDKAQIPPFLLEYLQNTFTLDKMLETFPELEPHEMATLFGEGYGAKIQKGGNYRPDDVSFRLFDVWISDKENPLGGWWLEPENVVDISKKLEIKTVPILADTTISQAVGLLKALPCSLVAQQDSNQNYVMEGVVARTKPLMFTRRGKRVMWKLKIKDFQR